MMNVSASESVSDVKVSLLVVHDCTYAGGYFL